MYTLIIFSTPPDGVFTLTTDRGDVIPGHPATHPTGRQGIGFDIPTSCPNGNGAHLSLVFSDHRCPPIDQRGILWLNDGHLPFPWTPGQTAALNTDDFTSLPVIARLPPLRVAGSSFAQG